MPPLDPSVILSVVQLLGTIGGAALAVKLQISRLTDGQAEMLRQLSALHKRMDIYGERISGAEIKHAVLLERVDNMRDTQRIRRAMAEATAAHQPPMFEREDG